MKTTNFKTLILVASIVFSVISTDGQHLTGITKNVFNQIPANLKLPATPQRYLITTDYFNHTLQGAFIDKIRVSGTFTTNLPQNKEVWNKVSVAKSNQLNGSFDTGEPQNYMENFT